MKKIAIVGGGASGLIAACCAVNKQNRVVLFEKQKKIGRKLLVTGNGRCNISNRFVSVEGYNGSNPKFVNNILSRFGLAETTRFFRSIGIPFCEGKDGRLFPSSLQAASVCTLFEHELNQRGVDVRLHRRIDVIQRGPKGFSITTAGKEKFTFDSVVLAAGSCAFPKIGGSKSGYKLAGSLGHSVVPPIAAILPINIPLKALHRLQGVKWDCGLTIMNNRRVVQQSTGELLFTAYGISGPVTLDISRSVNKLVVAGESPGIEIDFFPDMQLAELNNLLEELWKDGNKQVALSLLGIINNKIPYILFPLLSINPEKPVRNLNKGEKQKIVAGLKAFRLLPGQPRGFDEAVVAAGGVNVNELDPATLQSKIVPGLYITGELLDIDGISGGYNLQFAWSTGALAGKALTS